MHQSSWHVGLVGSPIDRQRIFSVFEIKKSILSFITNLAPLIPFLLVFEKAARIYDKFWEDLNLIQLYVLVF